MTVLEYDVISVVHVSSDSGNHFPVLFCNLHRVEHSALVFSDKVLNVCVDRHSLVCCERPDNIFHSFRNCEVYSFIMLFIKIILVFCSVHDITLHQIKLIASSLVGSSMWV